MEHLDLEVATEFLLIAATLVELKARRLLPGDDDVDLDDELALWEERDLLLARLLECKTFKDAAVVLRRLADDAARSCPRHGRARGALPRPGPRPARRASTPTTCAPAFLRAVAPEPEPRVDLDHVAPIRASVADAVEELVDELPRVGRITLPRAHRLAGRAPRGRRALPRRPRAVQAGPGRPRPGPHTSATSRSSWLGRDAPRSDDAAVASTPTRLIDVLPRAELADEARRAARGHLMVAEDAGRAPAAGPAARAARRPGRGDLRRAGRRATRPRTGASSLVAGGRRLPLPEPPRPGALRRALRARGPVGPAVRRRARDAGHRRLQAADVPGPGGGHPRRQRRRRDAHAPAPRATSPRSARDPGPGQAVLYGTTPAVPRAPRPRLARRPAAAGASSCPAPTWSRRSSRACACRRVRSLAERLDELEAANAERAAEPGRADLDESTSTTTDAAEAVPERGRGRLQKVLARAGFGSRRVCEDLIERRPGHVNGEVAVLGRRVDPEADVVEVDGAPVGVRPASSTTC